MSYKGQKNPQNVSGMSLVEATEEEATIIQVYYMTEHLNREENNNKLKLAVK